MADHTLVDWEIRDYLQNRSLLFPYSFDSINGASYDIRLGRLAFRASSNGSLGYQVRDVSKENGLIIESGNIVVIESLEKLELPLNMKGYLSLRNTLSSKMLFFTSGKVHPGHHGYLYFPLINLGDEPVVLQYEDKIVALELIEIDPPAETPGQTFETIPEELILNLGQDQRLLICLLKLKK